MNRDGREARVPRTDSGRGIPRTGGHEPAREMDQPLGNRAMYKRSNTAMNGFPVPALRGRFHSARITKVPQEPMNGLPVPALPGQG